MKFIEIQKTPNQSLSYTSGSNNYDLIIKEANGDMYVDVEINGVTVLTASRIEVNAPLIPYEYLSQADNFIFITQNNEQPYYDQFGVTQFLLTMTAADIANA